MDINEFEKLRHVEEKKHLITVDDLENKSDRTLLLGYTNDYHHWHVYLRKGEIRTVAYQERTRSKNITVEENTDYLPDWRLYPQYCDFEFCKVLIEYGVALPFTVLEDVAEKKQYYGEVFLP